MHLSSCVCDLLQEIGRESCILALQEHFIFEKLLPDDLIVYSIGSFKDCYAQPSKEDVEKGDFPLSGTDLLIT